MLLRREKFDEAIDAYKQASVASKDKELTSKAKYNLGNSFFNLGLTQQEEPEKAIESFENGIDYWRQSQQTKTKNTAASKNIEVERLTIQQLKKLMQQQQEQQQQQEDMQKKLEELKEQQEQLQQQTKE